MSSMSVPTPAPTRYPVPLAAAAAMLHLSPGTLRRSARRAALGLVDVPPPPGGGGNVWLSAASVEAASAARQALRAALRGTK